MFARIAAVLFAIALLFELIRKEFGPVLTVGTLTTAGLLFVALHLSGLGVPRLARYRRR
jgi:hypothetical protein